MQQCRVHSELKNYETGLITNVSWWMLMSHDVILLTFWWHRETTSVGLFVIGYLTNYPIGYLGNRLPGYGSPNEEWSIECYILTANVLNDYTYIVQITIQETIRAQVESLQNSRMCKIHIIRPYHTTTYIDAPYCYRPSSVVSLSQSCALQQQLNCLRCCFDCGLRESCTRLGSRSPWKGAILTGKRGGPL